MKKLLMLILSLVSLSASAQVPGNTVRVDSLASQFAMQAGTIAGVVQSCGQSIVEYNSRVTSAVNVLSKTPQDQMQAMMAYQKSLSDAQQAQNRTHSVNCEEAMKSFNSLPLMQPDYKSAVLPQLAKMATPQSFAARAAETPPPTPSGNPAVNPTTGPPATKSITPTTPGYQ